MTRLGLRAHLSHLLDRLWYGPVQPEPDPEVLAPILEGRSLWLGGLTPAQLLTTHQHQRDGRETTPNDCAVVSMAMIIHQALWLAGYTDIRVPYPDLARAMDRAPLYGRGFYRVPFVGAVPPGRAAAALRCIAQAFVADGHPRPWRVRLQGHMTQEALLFHLRAGYPTILYGVGHTGVPHAVVLAGYDPALKQWHILDPAYPWPYRGRAAFARWSPEELARWWHRRYFAYKRYTALWLTDIPRPRPVAEAEPVPQTLPLVPAA